MLYNRGLINAMLGVEAIRTAQEKFGNKPMTGEQVRWGLENLDLDRRALKELGFEGVLQPIKVSCADHEGARTGPHPAVGRQGVEGHLRLVHSADHVDPRPDGQGRRRPSTRPRRRSRRATAPRRAELDVDASGRRPSRRP